MPFKLPSSIPCLQVTFVQVYLIQNPTTHTKAFVRILLNDQLQLVNLRVVEGAGGLFVAYPNDPQAAEPYRSLFYPVTKELRDHIESVVVAKYTEATLDRPSAPHTYTFG